MSEDNTYMNLTGRTEKEIREDYRNRWEKLTLKEIEADFDNKEIKRSKEVEVGVRKMINAYRNHYKQISVEMKIK